MTQPRGADAEPPTAAEAARQILIVDDDPGAIQALANILDGCGQLRFATSGAEALRLARETLPDLVLLDAEMPAMNGFAVCRAMKGDHLLAQVPVIFVTSHREPDFKVEALGLGAADFISKPPMAEQVLARVRAQLRGPSTSPAASKRVGRPTRLLIFDAEPSALQFERIVLAPMVSDLQFADADVARLEEMMQSPPDLVLVGVDMPGLDGFAVCRELQVRPALRQVPVLVVSGRADWRAEAHAFELGASDFIARPYNANVLQARVRNLLRRVRRGHADSAAGCGAWQQLGDARVADLVAVAADPLLSVDAGGNVVLINAAASRLIGLDAAQALGRPLTAVRREGRVALDAARTWHLGEGATRITVMRLSGP